MALGDLSAFPSDLTQPGRAPLASPLPPYLAAPPSSASRSLLHFVPSLPSLGTCAPPASSITPIGDLSARTPHPSALAGCTWPRRRLSSSSHAGPLHAVLPPDPTSSSSCIGVVPTLRAPPGPAAASLSSVPGSPVSPSSSSPHPSVPLRANPVGVPPSPRTSALRAAALPNLTPHPAPPASVGCARPRRHPSSSSHAGPLCTAPPPDPASSSHAGFRPSHADFQDGKKE
ncbi:hypothetical protein U9M48_021973 [Paspalum notatum var. saurae]|uniref:Uncharacterized protein n=1 Tax=Paspalum notatum var. saurae TaxID=547442 RepID=A0AAQ3WUA1_PASNO